MSSKSGENYLKHRIDATMSSEIRPTFAANFKE